MVRGSSKMQPRLRKQWVLLNEELRILASYFLSPTNSAVDELRVKRFAVMQREICWTAFCRWVMLESNSGGWKEKSWASRWWFVERVQMRILVHNDDQQNLGNTTGEDTKDERSEMTSRTRTSWEQNQLNTEHRWEASKMSRFDGLRGSRQIKKTDMLRLHRWSDHYGRPAYCVAEADIIFLPCGFFYLLLLLFSFPRLLSAVGDWMSTILPHMVWP